MPFQFFSIPVPATPTSADEMNRFLSSHRVLAVRSELAMVGSAAFWAFNVEYAERGEGAGDRSGARIDYREVPNEPQFAIYSRLRDWRKAEAEKEKVPVYAVLTNEQLAEIARRTPQTPEELGKIDGIGEARLGKYAGAVLKVLAATTPVVAAGAGRK